MLACVGNDLKKKIIKAEVVKNPRKKKSEKPGFSDTKHENVMVDYSS